MNSAASFADLVDLAELKMVEAVVGPAPAMRPLSERNRARVTVMREGALDYRAIPSRMGDVLVPHGAKVAA